MEVAAVPCTEAARGLTSNQFMSLEQILRASLLSYPLRAVRPDLSRHNNNLHSNLSATSGDQYTDYNATMQYVWVAKILKDRDVLNLLRIEYNMRQDTTNSPSMRICDQAKLEYLHACSSKTLLLSF
jgi:hypothetical protein